MSQSRSFTPNQTTNPRSPMMYHAHPQSRKAAMNPVTSCTPCRIPHSCESSRENALRLPSSRHSRCTWIGSLLDHLQCVTIGRCPLVVVGTAPCLPVYSLTIGSDAKESIPSPFPRGLRATMGLVSTEIHLNPVAHGRSTHSTSSWSEPLPSGLSTGVSFWI